MELCGNRTRKQETLTENQGMNLAMGRKKTRPTASLALMLSLVASLPSLEWCPFPSCDRARSCEATAVTAGASCPAAIACAAAPECSAAGTGRTDDARPCTAKNVTGLPCDADPDPIPFGDRVWCIHPPVEGVVARDIDLPLPDASAWLATLVRPVDLDVPCPRPKPRVERAPRSPVLALPHAPPLSRAPPAV